MPKPKIVFIEAKSDLDILLSKEQLAELPAKTGLVTTIQHLHKLSDVKQQLPDAVIGGQILGCDVSCAERIKDEVDAFLFIGTGRFHPLAVFEKTKREVFCFNPETRVLDRVSQNEIDIRETRIRGAYLRFLVSKNIGVLVSTKKGQNRLDEARALRERFLDKRLYFLVSDSVDFSQLENFIFVDCFVNTACPRLTDDYDKFPKPVINLGDLQDLQGNSCQG